MTDNHAKDPTQNAAQTADPPRSKVLSAFGFLLLGIAILGLLPTTYLVLESRQIALDAPETSGICTAIGGYSCRGALTSDDAKIGGITLSYIGSGWYVALTFFLLLSWIGRDAGVGWPATPWPLLALLAGLAASIPAAILVTRLFTSDYDPCPLCLATHGVTFLFTLTALIAWIVSLWHRRRTNVEPPRSIVLARYLFTGAAALAAIAVGAVIALGAHYQELRDVHRDTKARLESLRELPAVRRQEMMANIETLDMSVREALLDQPFPSKGNPDAPITILEVSDFQCPSCRQAHPELQNLMRDYGETVRLDFMHFPLDQSCNESVERSMHPQACDAHVAAIAAGNQGKFWEYADLLFANQDRFAEEPWIELAKQLNLDVEQFRRDMDAPETRFRLLRDIALGIEMRIYGTPRFLVNGRLYPPNIKPEELFMRALEELAGAGSEDDSNTEREPPATAEPPAGQSASATE